MTSAMYETQLVEDRRRELFEGARDYRLAKLARRRRRSGRYGGRRSDEPVA